MRQTRIYQTGSYQKGDRLTLDESAAHHLATVLRARVGEKLFLFNGQQTEFNAEVTAIRKKRVEVLIGDEVSSLKESPLQIHLGQAICKGDKMDWILQKGTELGVQTFTPILSSRAAHEISDPIRCEKKMKHWQGVIIHATEQCGRNQLPQLNPPIGLEEFITTDRPNEKWILSPHTTTRLKDCPPPKKNITLLVGPEGGWSDLELLNASQGGFQPVTLGPRILRTESAPIAMISILQYMAGDF